MRANRNLGVVVSISMFVIADGGMRANRNFEKRERQGNKL